MYMNSVEKFISLIEEGGNSDQIDKMFETLMLEYASGSIKGLKASLSSANNIFRRIPKWDQIGISKNSEIAYFVSNKIVRYPAFGDDKKIIHHQEYYDDFKSSTFYARIDHSKKIIGILPSKNLGNEYTNILEKFIEELSTMFKDYIIYGKSSIKSSLDILSEEFIETRKVKSYLDVGHGNKGLVTGNEELYIINNGKIIIRKDSGNVKNLDRVRTHFELFDDYQKFRFRGRFDHKRKIITLLDEDNYGSIPHKDAENAARILQKNYRNYTIILFTSNTSYEWI